MNNLIGGGTAFLALLEEIKVIKQKIGTIGTVYGGSFDPVSLIVNQNTIIAELTVPPGTYIVTGIAEIDISENSTYNLSIAGRGNVRFNGYSGGGGCVSTIFETDTGEKLELRLFSPVQNIKSKNVTFYAVKIK